MFLIENIAKQFTSSFPRYSSRKYKKVFTGRNVDCYNYSSYGTNIRWATWINGVLNKGTGKVISAAIGRISPQLE